MKGNRAKVAAWEQSHFGVCTVPDWLDCDVPMQETLQMDIQRVERTISKEQEAVSAAAAEGPDPFSMGYGKLKKWILNEKLLPPNALKQCRSPAAMLRAVHTAGFAMTEAQMAQLIALEAEDSTMRVDPNNKMNRAWEQVREDQVFEPASSLAADSPRVDGMIRFVVVSDSHSTHEQMGPLPEGDVLLHCGDFTKTGVP